MNLVLIRITPIADKDNFVHIARKKFNTLKLNVNSQTTTHTFYMQCFYFETQIKEIEFEILTGFVIFQVI